MAVLHTTVILILIKIRLMFKIYTLETINYADLSFSPKICTNKIKEVICW